MIYKKMFSRKMYKLILFFFTVLNCLSLSAKEKKWEQICGYNHSASSTVGNSSQTIGISSSLNIVDPEINQANYFSVSNKTYIELKIDDYIGPYYWYQFKIQLKITPILNDGSNGVPYSTALSVENNRYGGFGNFIDLQKQLIIEGARGAQVEVIDFNTLNKESGVNSSIAPNNVSLILSYEVERYYDVTTSSITVLAPTNLHNAIDNNLTISWQNIPEAEAYELEWTWIDNYSDSNINNLLPPSSVPLSTREFELNNTRIQTTNNNYIIPLVYDRGYIAYRVRPVGRFLTNYLKKYEGNWSTDGPSIAYVSNWSYYIISTDHNILNWQFKASYAEDGKKKEVVSYFDGSLRNRQTVTNINTNNKAVVGEVIYDEEGRPAVEVLPVPIDQKALKYYPDFNKNDINQKVYSYQDFNSTLANTCNLSAAGMDPSTGASKYYSSNNTANINYQDFVPSSENHPFSQTEYALDNTGRIKKKGGVGTQHQLGTGHEMSYFYTVPTQEELNRLFGYSVGNVAHYKKNIVIDPNHQVSTSYLDPKGKTIATALNSVNPENLKPLEDETNNTLHNLISTDLLHKLNPDDTDTESDNNIKYYSSNYWNNYFDGLRYDAQKVFTEPNEYKFKYKMNKANAFEYQCGTDNTYYYPFIYNLKLSVIDECGTNKLSYDDDHIKEVGANNSHFISDDPNTTQVEQGIKLGNYDVTTSPSNQPVVAMVAPNSSTTFNNAFDETFNFTLDTSQLGAYGISKKLEVDQDALELFANDYIRRGKENGCILAPQSPDVDLTPCYYSCDQCVAYYSENPTENPRGGIYPRLTFIDANGNPIYGQNAYVATQLEGNAELSALVPGTQDYIDLLGLLTIRYEREWELLKLECRKPCDNGTPPSGGETSSITCQNSLGVVMQDMSPTGQYGVYSPNTDSNGNVIPTSTPPTPNNPNLNAPLSAFNEVIAPSTSSSTTTNTNQIVAIAEGIDPYHTDWRHPNYYDANHLLPNILNPNNTDLKHYYTLSGEIDYVQIRWDNTANTFIPPLVSNYNTIPSTPAAMTIVKPVDVAQNLYEVEPQFLANVTDFMELMLTRESWQLSLVKYHPEFHYLDYQLNSCSTTKVTNSFNVIHETPNDLLNADTVTLNSDGLDSLIGSITTFDGAINAHFLDSDLSLFNEDPLFQTLHPNDGTILTVMPASNTTSANVIKTINQNLQQQMLFVKRQIMCQALTKSIAPALSILPTTSLPSFSATFNDGYEVSGHTMAQAAFAAVFCPTAGAPQQYLDVINPPVGSATLTSIVNFLNSNSSNNSNNSNNPNISTEDKDKFWKYYVSYYLGLKQKIQHVFLNLHAQRMGFYNGCIGNNNYNQDRITSVIGNYPAAKTLIENWLISFPTTSCATNYSLLGNYTKRFIPYDEYYNSEQSAEDVYQNTMSTINSTYYNQSGICPNVRDLELFLNTAPTKLDMYPVFQGSTNTATPYINYLTASLVQTLGGATSPTGIAISTAAQVIGIVTNPSILSNNNRTITLNFTQGGIPIPHSVSTGDHITLTIPSGYQKANGSQLIWDNTYGNTWNISKMNHLTPGGYDQATGLYHFQIAAQLAGTDFNGQYQNGLVNYPKIYQVTLDGTTTIPLFCTTSSNNNDSTSGSSGTPVILDSSSDNGCNKKELFSSALLQLITHIQNSGQIDDSIVPISNQFFPPYLATFLGLNMASNPVIEWRNTQIPFGDHGRYVLYINGLPTFAINYAFDSDPNITFDSNPLTSITIGGMAGDIDNSAYDFGNYITFTNNAQTYHGYIFLPANHPSIKQHTIVFDCCTPCGEWDYDWDGIPDNGVFDGCDTCDNRIDTDHDGTPDCGNISFFNVGQANSSKSCGCIPQTPIFANIQEKYDIYMNLCSEISGLPFYSPSDFNALNLQFITQGYYQYIHDVFHITSISDPNYLTIAQFGATALNYGFQYYSDVINGYHAYVTNPTNPPTMYELPDHSYVEINTWPNYALYYLNINPKICPPKAMISDLSNVTSAHPVIENNCMTFYLSIAETYNEEAYQAYINAKKMAFKKAYLEKALNDVVENFEMNSYDKEYQYTLYYYDQAGNLTQTVAPQGVNRLNGSQNFQINNDRINDTQISALPQHTFKTQYRYNSLNQLVWQSTPDGGETRFAYDLLGRIVASQNAVQVNNTIIRSSFDLASLLKTVDNTVINIGKDGDYSLTGGISSQLFSQNSFVEYTVNAEETKNQAGVIFGLALNTERNGIVEYGFLHENNRTFGLIGVKNNTNYPVLTGDILKIERSNGNVSFYQNGLLIHQEKDRYTDISLYLSFYLPHDGNKVSNINSGIYKDPRDFSYTCYDRLGRIREAGQFKATQNISIDDNGKLVFNSNSNWVGVSAIDDNYPQNVSKEQVEVTKTLYDNYDPFDPNEYLSPQPVRNIRNRVTTILTYDKTLIDTPLEDYETAIFYNYDIHGNVNEMAQTISKNVLYNEAEPDGVIKRVNYEYDLISGNVNKVIYQKDNPEDQFIHKYNYDADNRITFVETSRDNVIWEKDASYLYYDHGPLAKVILGDKQVQGIDYAYTLQGWLKTVNSENLSGISHDMGGDGNHISKDAFGFSLSYFNNDYQARNMGSNNAYSVSNSSSDFTGIQLFNGNINRMITTLRDDKEVIKPTQVNLYSYDQLNRIFDMHSFQSIENNGQFSQSESYKTNYSYDRNGNLQHLYREAPNNADNTNDPSSIPMDKFTYVYNPGNNQLNHIVDEVSSDTFDVDIDNQDINNYQYNTIGELISDVAEGIKTINWRVDGKVKSIIKDNGLNLNFYYDGLGNRVLKKKSQGRRGSFTTHYSRDAQGNVMGVYNLSNTDYGYNKYLLKEHHIYGSSRLGMQTYEPSKEEAPSTDNPFLTGTQFNEPENMQSFTNYSRLVGDKRYELTNHLGNVLNVINDRKLVTHKIKAIFVDPVDQLSWYDIGKAKVEMTEGGQIETHVFADSSGIGRIIPIDIGNDQQVVVQFSIKKAKDFPSNSNLTFTIKDPKKDTVLLSIPVPADGQVNTTFAPPTAGEYLVSVTTDYNVAVKEAGTEAETAKKTLETLYQIAKDEGIEPDETAINNAKIAIETANNTLEQIIANGLHFYADDLYVYSVPIIPGDFVALYLPDVLNYNDYYPFGSLVPNRHASTSDYRYGFNDKEKDDEVKDEGDSYDYEKRFYDPRVGRFLSIDPMFKAFAWFSPYQFAGNSPISCVDLDGLEMYFAADGSFLGQSKNGGSEIRIATKYTPLKAQKNGKIDEGFRITKSIPVDYASFATQGKIYQTIYDREIGGKAKIEVNNKYADGESIKGGTAAHTIPPLGEGSIVVNPDFYEEYNGKIGIGNSDYYSATAVLKHEEKHFEGLGSDPWTDHLQVWIQTFKEIVKDGTYSKLGNDHKDYIYKVGAGYIDEMKMSLSTKKGVKSEDFDYAYDLLKKNVELFNKVSGSKLEVGSKESYLETRKYNDEN